MRNRLKSMDNTKSRPLSLKMRYRLKEGLFLFTIGIAIFFWLSLFTFHPSDPGWSYTGSHEYVANWGGRVGSWLADVILSLFGLVSYLFPLLLIVASWCSLREKEELVVKRFWLFKIVGWLIILLSIAGLVGFHWRYGTHLPAEAGGILGDLLDRGLYKLFNRIGSTLFLITVLLCGLTLVTGLSWLGVLDFAGKKLLQLMHGLYRRYKVIKPIEVKPPVIKTKPEIAKTFPSTSLETPPIIVKAAPTHSLEKKKPVIDSSILLSKGMLPPLSLLNSPPQTHEKPFAHTSFEELSLLVESRLADFGVSAKVVAVHPGPIITRFELDLAPGIKVSKITGIAKDIARSLSVQSVRIVDVIPGKSVIGLEIPNENRELVTLRDILESQRYAQSRSPVSLVLGKDISGNPLVVDLTKMPHLLVAGTTGSGKSVSLNAMLLSMLFKATPEQLRFILIDPKMLELSVYDGIPHLLTPVITDMKDAANALRWCVAEMDKRYRLMAALGVRNIASYNQRVLEAIKQGQPLLMPGTLVTDEASAKTELEPLPLIVVIADELADMMMVVGKKVEDLIARIAQKARAAGIHLILATQRPSVDVITGLIKANIPTRVAFQVSSRIDSRTILDQQGAEQLLGYGDMLYLPPGMGVPIRVHGAYVADDEVHRVVAAWQTFGQPIYLHEVTEEVNPQGEDMVSGEQDVLYDEAVRIVTESRKASISLVQRRLRIGYNRAARMMEEMEMAGIVSSMDHNGTREVLAAPPPPSDK